VYALVAPVEVEVTEVELFLLAGDSEPRGSSNRLISRIGEVDRLRASPYVAGSGFEIRRPQSPKCSKLQVCGDCGE
jgi:hypothetical protein